MKKIKIDIMYVNGFGEFNGMGVLTDEQMTALGLLIDPEVENEVTFEGEFDRDGLKNVYTIANGQEVYTNTLLIDVQHAMYQIEAEAENLLPGSDF